MLCGSIGEAEALTLDTDRYKANIKFDGERIITLVLKGDVVMINRNGKICNYHFREVEAELKGLGDCVIDGEVISLDDDFSKLQRRALTQNLQKIKQLEIDIPVKYMVFDCLMLGSEDLRNKPLMERLESISKLIGDNHAHLGKVGYEAIQTQLEIAKREGREGIIIKDMKAKYEGKRGEAWRKLKFFQEAVITFQKYTSNPKGIRVETNDGLVACQVSGKQSEEIQHKLDTNGSVDIYIQYLTKSADGHLRFPSCRGIAN